MFYRNDSYINVELFLDGEWIKRVAEATGTRHRSQCLVDTGHASSIQNGRPILASDVFLHRCQRNLEIELENVSQAS